MNLSIYVPMITLDIIQYIPSMVVTHQLRFNAIAHEISVTEQQISVHL